MYKIIVFDLDDTLSKSKTPADFEMIDLLRQLLDKYKVAIITGGGFPQIDKQILAQFDKNITNLSDFFPFPTCGTKMYEYKNSNFEISYSEDLTKEESNKIISAFEKAIKDLGLQPEQTWGEIVENRGTQITYSALGQECPLDIKSKWDPDLIIRQKIRDYIMDDLSEFQIGIAGKSSVDITKKGIDKAYGIQKIIDNLGIKKEEILFLGDMMMPGGNDYPVKEFGIDCIAVNNSEDTKIHIKELLK